MKVRLGHGNDHVRDQRCPKCQCETVVYNGNYWCEHCDWVMGEKGSPRRIIDEYLNQRFEEAEVKGDQDEMDRMRFYMDAAS